MFHIGVVSSALAGGLLSLMGIFLVCGVGGIWIHLVLGIPCLILFAIAFRVIDEEEKYIRELKDEIDSWRNINGR